MKWELNEKGYMPCLPSQVVEVKIKGQSGIQTGQTINFKWSNPHQYGTVKFWRFSDESVEDLDSDLDPRITGMAERADNIILDSQIVKAAREVVFSETALLTAVANLRGML